VVAVAVVVTSGNDSRRTREVGEDGDVRSIRPIVPHELERVDEKDDDQITGQE
jgi:hypothetical protein